MSRFAVSGFGIVIVVVSLYTHCLAQEVGSPPPAVSPSGLTAELGTRTIPDIVDDFRSQRGSLGTSSAQSLVKSGCRACADITEWMRTRLSTTGFSGTVADLSRGGSVKVLPGGGEGSAEVNGTGGRPLFQVTLRRWHAADRALTYVQVDFLNADGRGYSHCPPEVYGIQRGRVTGGRLRDWEPCAGGVTAVDGYSIEGLVGRIEDAEWPNVLISSFDSTGFGVPETMSIDQLAIKDTTLEMVWSVLKGGHTATSTQISYDEVSGRLEVKTEYDGVPEMATYWLRRGDSHPKAAVKGRRQPERW